MVTALATSRPRRGSTLQTASTSPGAARPPPMKTAPGDGSPASASGASPVTICSRGVPLDGDGGKRAAGAQPLDRDGAAARADVPEQLAGQRRQGRQGRRPDLA